MRSIDLKPATKRLTVALATAILLVHGVPTGAIAEVLSRDAEQAEQAEQSASDATADVADTQSADANAEDSEPATDADPDPSADSVTANEEPAPTEDDLDAADDDADAATNATAGTAGTAATDAADGTAPSYDPLDVDDTWTQGILYGTPVQLPTDTAKPVQDASGTCGANDSVSWQLYDDGTLVLKPEDGANNPAFGKDDLFPWENGPSNLDASKVYAIKFEEANDRNITLPSDWNWTNDGSNVSASRLSLLPNLKHVDFRSLDTSSVQDANRMFSQCKKLESVDMRDCQLTAVSDMGYMFYRAGVDTSSSDVHPCGEVRGEYPALQSMYGLFHQSSIDELKITDFTAEALVENGSNLRAMRAIAADCPRLVKAEMTRVKVGSTSDTFTLAVCFRNCTALTSISLDDVKVNARIAIDFSGLFQNAYKAKTVSFSDVELGAPYVNLNSIFWGCGTLADVDLSWLKGKKVLDAFGLFFACSSLTSVDLRGVDFSEATSIRGLFGSCTKLSSVAMGDAGKNSLDSGEANLRGFRAPKATDVGKIFDACTSLKAINLDNADFSSATVADAMMSGCTGLTSVSMQNVDMGNVTTHWKLNEDGSLFSGSLFHGCTALEKIDMAGTNLQSLTSLMIRGDKDQYGNVPALTTMFYNCKKVSKLDMSGVNLSGVSNLAVDRSGNKSVNYHALGDLDGLQELDMSKINLSSAKDMGSLFSNLRKIKSASFEEAILSSEGVSLGYTFSYTSIETFTMKDAKGSILGMGRMFIGCGNLKAASFENVDASAGGGLSETFSRCERLERVTLPCRFRTTGPIDMYRAFYLCKSLTSINLESLRGVKPYNLAGAFAYTSLQSLDLSMLSVDELIGMGANGTSYGCGVVEGCSSLKSIKLPKGSASHKSFISFYRTFSGCSGLEEIDISEFDAPKVEELFDVYKDVGSLKRVVLGASSSKKLIAALPDPTDATTYTSNWTLVDGEGDPITDSSGKAYSLSPADLAQKIGTSEAPAGTWTREIRVTELPTTGRGGTALATGAGLMLTLGCAAVILGKQHRAEQRRAA